MKVLFTAGTQFAFPRMARAVDAVASQRPEWELVFQAGPGAEGKALPAEQGVLARPLFPADEFNTLFAKADLVVTHAGMGNILLCLEQAKPFVMMPRLARLGEHRNDHQVDTAEAIMARYAVPYYREVEALVGAIVEQRAESLCSVNLLERIDHERLMFGKHLNSLIESL